MKLLFRQVTCGLLTLLAVRVSAATLYVSLNSTNPIPPYANWSTAATNIQDAIDASTNGDLILVTNGVYAAGGKVVYGSLTNRVVIDKAVAVQSLNGPAVTIIQGFQVSTGATNFDSDVRCVYMTNNAMLSGFTLANGATRATGSDVTQLSGGGVYCESTNATLTNCVLTGNLCAGEFSGAGGGAVYRGTLNGCILTNNSVSTNVLSYGASGGAALGSVLNHCLIISNSASFGGGAAGSTLNYCTVVGNSAPVYGSTSWGGGTYMCTANHCLIAGNYSATGGGGDDSGILSFCILSNNICGIQSPWVGQGGGSYQQSPDGSYTPMLYNCLVVSNWSGNGGGVYIAGSGPILTNCTIVGNTATNEGGGVCHGTLKNCIIYGNYCPSVFSFTSNFFGVTLSSCWTNDPEFANPWAGDYRLQSNSPCVDAGSNAFVSSTVDLDGKARIVNGIVDIGAYEFQGNVRYVSLGSTNPIAPYSDWSIAATNIQDAVDAAEAGDTVLVTNGVYASGGRALSRADVTNRVSVTNAVSVRSVNGPAATVIQGYQVAGTIASTSAVRCAYVGNGALLSGFTLTNGEAGTGNYVNGGGISGVVSGTVSNCVVAGNICAGAGGGANGVTLIDCLLTGNYGVGGGAASWSDLLRCTLTNNLASWAGGLLSSQATNCLIAANSATNYGGGSGFSTLVDCTVAANFLAPGHGGNGGGSYHDTLFNCIVYNNTAPNGSNYYSSAMQCCCTAPAPGGTGNIANAPLMVNQAGGDFHLSSNSPCINSGNNAYIISTTDLDGNPRIVGGTVDIGAYEYQTPVSRISYAWLQQYGLTLATNTDNADQDGDHMNNYQEWVAGTNPTNASSLLEMLSPVSTNNVPGLFLSWKSVSGRIYFLQRSANLATQPAFLTIQNNLAGQAGTTSYTDTNATGNGPYFYRVGVQQ